MKVNISRKSIHFKLFSIIKKVQYSISKKIEEGSIDSLNLVKQSGLYKKLNDKWKLTTFSFTIRKNPIELGKYFLKRLCLYQLWGNGIVAIALLPLVLAQKAQLAGDILGIIIVLLIYGIIVGILPFFSFLFIGVILKYIGQCFFVGVNVLRGRELKDKEIEPSKYLLGYILSFIIIPLWCFVEIFLATLVRVVITGTWCNIMAVVWFVEIIWLFLNFCLLILGGIILLFKKPLVIIGNVFLKSGKKIVGIFFVKTNVKS